MNNNYHVIPAQAGTQLIEYPRAADLFVPLCGAC